MTPSTRMPHPTPGASSDDPSSSGVLLRDFNAVRQASLAICAPLEAEDFVVQSMPEASPAKWHLAHTTWFFEEFILGRHVPDYRPFHSRYSFLFNSYYNTVGQRIPRPQRGLMTRPTVHEVLNYRKYVDEQVNAFLRTIDPEQADSVASLVTLGLNHEQQHQELLLTDLKHAFWHNPLRPAYAESPAGSTGEAHTPRWFSYPEGIRWVGFEGEGFAYDNEGPRHRHFLDAFHVASRPVTNAEFLGFIEDEGYARPELWLSDGWAAVQQQGWQAPLYWEQVEGRWWSFTLAGMAPVDPSEPVCHVSFYEADAYARWAGARLPNEAEWETAADVALEGNFLESGRFHPAPASSSVENEPIQMFGDVWEWTASSYLPYPGFRPAPGAVGEYNGKFMCNQQVLRGGSCLTSRSHVRPTYRNFFYPDARWQFSGFRLALP